MALLNEPDIADALQDAFEGTDFNTPGDTPYLAADPDRVDAEFFLKPVQDELLALHAARVASMAYRRSLTCLAGLAVGDPVYLSAATTATLAIATTITTARVVGFVRYKPSTTTCYLDHFYYKTGLSGLTAGAAVYLSNAGGFSTSAGTINKIVGVALSTTTALLFASPVTAFGSAAVDPVTAKTANYTITANDHLTTFTNTGAAGSITFTLPTVASGLRYRFARTAAQTIVVSGGTVYLADTSGTSSTMTSLGTMELVCDGTNWIVTYYTGGNTVA